MKFCEKLTMQRKKNNMSQELLADRLGVSRQAVSKWESGSSIPDMERIIEICRVLNCNLDDLMDDGVIGSTSKKEDKNCNIINTYLKEFLDFVTRSLNMFWSMRFRDKIKCIMELLFISLILYLLWSMFYHILYSVFNGLFDLLPELLYKIIHNVFEIIFSILGLTLGTILVIHIFRIRYLDYFVTIYDNNATCKSVETPVDEDKIDNSKDRKFIEKRKNKIIIRDPKHSTYGFFDFLATIAVFIIKGILTLISLLGIGCFVFLIFNFTFSIIKMTSGIFFVGTSISILGYILINYICLKVIFCFIFNQRQKFKRSFIIFMIGLLLTGIGTGISFTAYLSFNESSDNVETQYDVYNYEIEMKSNTVLSFLNDNNTEVVIDDNIDNIKVDVTYNNMGFIEFNSYDNMWFYDEEDEDEEYDYEEYDYEEWFCYYYNFDKGFINEFNYLIDKLESKERIDNIYDHNGIANYKIIVNSDNLEVLKNNYKRLYN